MATDVPFVDHCDKITITHFDQYSTLWHLAVFHTKQIYAQPLFCAHQYFQVYPKFQSTYKSLNIRQLLLRHKCILMYKQQVEAT